MNRNPAALAARRTSSTVAQYATTTTPTPAGTASLICSTASHPLDELPTERPLGPQITLSDDAPNRTEHCDGSAIYLGLSLYLRRFQLWMGSIGGIGGLLIVVAGLVACGGDAEAEDAERKFEVFAMWRDCAVPIKDVGEERIRFAPEGACQHKNITNRYVLVVESWNGNLYEVPVEQDCYAAAYLGADWPPDIETCNIDEAVFDMEYYEDRP